MPLQHVDIFRRPYYIGWKQIGAILLKASFSNRGGRSIFQLRNIFNDHFVIAGAQ